MKTHLTSTKNSDELSSLLIRVAIRALHIMNADVCGVWLVDENKKLVPHFYHGIKSEFAELLFSEENGAMLEAVLDLDTPIAVTDLYKTCKKDEVKIHVESEGLKSLLACPISLNGKKAGILAVGTKSKNRHF